MDKFIEDIKGAMIHIQGGRMWIGDRDSSYKTFLDLFPGIDKVEVQVSDFHLCSHTITEAEWDAVMESNIEKRSSSRLPKVDVSWNAVQEYIFQLNRKTGWDFRLPYEAEWEYASRGGEICDQKTMFSGSDILSHVGWFSENSGNMRHEICQRNPNILGLYDMSGNVWEYCQDFYSVEYQKGPKKGIFSSERELIIDPHGPITGSTHCIRGGSFSNNFKKCWVFWRNSIPSDSFFNNVGFRLAY